LVATEILHHSRLTGFPACSTKSGFSCGLGILPAHEKLNDIGVRSQLQHINPRMAWLNLDLANNNTPDSFQIGNCFVNICKPEKIRLAGN
jgi:hypothetical protein